MEEFIQLFLTCSGIILPVIISVYVFAKRSKDIYLKDKYEKVIFPIYNEIYPLRNKEQFDDEIKSSLNKCKDIVLSNRMIVDQLLFRFFENEINDLKTYKEFWGYIEISYHNCCKALGIQHSFHEHIFSGLYNKKYLKIISFFKVIFLIFIWCIIILFYLYFLQTLQGK